MNTEFKCNIPSTIMTSNPIYAVGLKCNSAREKSCDNDSPS